MSAHLKYSIFLSILASSTFSNVYSSPILFVRALQITKFISECLFVGQNPFSGQSLFVGIFFSTTKKMQINMCTSMAILTDVLRNFWFYFYFFIFENLEFLLSSFIGKQWQHFEGCIWVIFVGREDLDWWFGPVFTATTMIVLLSFVETIFTGKLSFKASPGAGVWPYVGPYFFFWTLAD